MKRNLPTITWKGKTCGSCNTAFPHPAHWPHCVFIFCLPVSSSSRLSEFTHFFIHQILIEKSAKCQGSILKRREIQWWTKPELRFRTITNCLVKIRLHQSTVYIRQKCPTFIDSLGLSVHQTHTQPGRGKLSGTHSSKLWNTVPKPCSPVVRASLICPKPLLKKTWLIRAPSHCLRPVQICPICGYFLGSRDSLRDPGSAQLPSSLAITLAPNK